MEPAIRPPAQAQRDGAFTLIEMLAVMAIIVLMVSLIGPAVTALQGASNVNRAVYDISGLLGQARIYSMSNNTYVYVGITEVAEGQADTAQPQQAGIGRVAMVVIASKDATSGYNLSNVSTSWAQTSAANGFLVIGKAQTFDNLHMVDLGQRPDSGQMNRPPYSSTDAIDPKSNLGDAACVSATPFSYPLGGTSSTLVYNFTKVIQFSPQGVARIQTADGSDVVAPWLEIGLQQSHGAAVSTLQAPVSTGAVAAIQVNGITGVARIYRP